MKKIATTVLIVAILMLIANNHAYAFNGRQFYDYTNPTATPWQKGAAFGYVRGFTEAAKAYDTRTVKTTAGWEVGTTICYPDDERIIDSVNKIRNTMMKMGTIEFMEKNMATWMTSIMPLLYPCKGI